MVSFLTNVLRFRLLIVALALGVLSLGVVQLRNASVDALPEFTPPYAEIQTEALGLSAEEVEQLITVPLEADLLNGVEGVETIRSESIPGLSSIVLVFAKGTDIYQARQLVQERLTQAHALPNVSKPPTLLQPLSSSNRVLMIGLSSADLTPIEQSVLAHWTIRPQLMGVPGVANISVWGMRDQQLQVQVDPNRLRKSRVTLNQIVSTTGNAQVVSPLTFLEASTPGTGGFIETPQQRLQVRHLIEKIADPAELAKVPVQGTNGRLQLGDVTDIKIDHQPLIGDAVIAGGPGLMLVVEKFPGASTAEVTAGVEEALEKLRPGLTGLTSDTTVFRPADYISDGMDNLGLGLIVGGILMLVALLAVRFHWRSALVAVVTVPLSLITAVLVLRLLGQELNALIFAGLAAAATILIDEAVAPPDHVVRRLREQEEAIEPEPVVSSITQAWAATRRPLIYATIVVGLAIVPVAVLDGRPGAFLAPLALAYALAVGSALLVALTVAPALSMLLFSRWRPGAARGSGLSERVGSRYEAAVARFGGKRGPVLLAVAACVLVGVVILPFLSVSLVPAFKDPNVMIRLEGPPGTSNVWMTQRATEVTKIVRGLPGVSGAGAHVGRAITGDRVVNVNSSDVWVSIDSDADYDKTVASLESAIREVPNVKSEVVSYTTQKMRDVGALVQGANAAQAGSLDLLTGVDRPIAVRIFGEDPEILQQNAYQVQKLLTGVEGVVDPVVVRPEMQSTIEIEVDLDKAQKVGMTPGDVRRAEATLVQGIQVGSLFEDQKIFDVIVQGTPATRESIEDIRNLLIDRPGGGHVRLGDVADVRTVETPSVIQRDAVSRRIDVVAGVDGRSAAEVAADIRGQLGTLSFPLEYHAEVVQQSTADEIGVREAIGVALAAAIAAFLLFQAAFRSWRLALLMTAALPLSLVGGLVAGLIAGPELGLGSLLGFLAVLAWTTRVGVVMISRLQSLDHEGMANDSTAMVMQRGARERLAPVVTSALAVGGVTLPFVVLGSRPGLEILHPLAVVLLGGLISAALVALFLVPPLYLHFGPRRSSHEQPTDGSAQPKPAETGAPSGWRSRRLGLGSAARESEA
jgi:Cu/Ag efflux pump CusA